jgi:hypothetical protein
MGAERSALSSGNQSIVPGRDIEWVEEFSEREYLTAV